MLRRNQYSNFTLSSVGLLSLLLLLFPCSLFAQDSSPASSDFDGDGTVGVSDYLLFVDVFGSQEGEATYDAKYDLDGNGEIGISDFLIFIDNFGKTVNSNNEESTSGGSGGSSGSGGSGSSGSGGNSGSGGSGNSGNSGSSGSSGSGGSSGGTSPRENNPSTPPTGQQQVIPQVTISAGTTPVTEGTAATFTITASSAPTSALTVNVNVTEDGDVISGTAPSSVTINANETSATLTVTTDDDSAVESNSVVTAEVESGTGYTVGSSSSASVTVNNNDDPPSVTISAGTSPVTEGEDVTFTITWASSPEGLGLEIDINETGDVMSGRIDIDNTNGMKLTIQTIDDDVDESNSVVTLTAQWVETTTRDAGIGDLKITETGANIGSPFSASVTVNDNDSP